MRARILVVFIFFFGIWVFVGLRAFYLQVFPNENIRHLRARQFETVVKLEPRRGDILDRNGNELATTVAAYSLFADPKIIKGPKKLASRLSSELNLPIKEVYSKLKNSQKRFVWIERRINQDVKSKIEAWRVSGLGFVEEGQRVYPHENLLSQTIGFVGREGNGLEGLEIKFENELRGLERKVNVRRDAFGRPLIANGQVFAERPGGATLQLTIDSELQYSLEEELRRATVDHEAERAMGVVLDAQTSEVLAIGAYPTFNPNTRSDLDAGYRRNPVVTDSFEPGSTLKTFTIAAALREGKIQPNTKYYCEKGKMKVGKRWIREADSKHQWEWLSVSQILEVSSNIGVAKIAFDLGEEKLRKAFADFGFGEKTGLEIPGETRGILPGIPWRQHHFSNISFGHGIAVSPIQMANAYAAIANGGILRQPTIIKSIVNAETKEPLPLSERRERRVFSESEAALLRLMLTGVTSSYGTGTKARVPGFIVAGKTGTAQKVDPNGRGYIKGTYISSFAGFVPANNPRFVIYVAVDSSKKGYYGSDVAAPIFNRVSESALRIWGVAPTIFAEKDLIKTKVVSKTRRHVEALVRETTIDTVPDLKGLTVREVIENLRGKKIDVEFKGNGLVMTTMPAQGERLTPGQKLKILLRE